MFFYIVHTKNSDLSHRKKIGITTIHIGHRLKAYRTSDVRVEYYKVYSFIAITLNDLIQIEKACLIATQKWAIDINEYPNNECRYVNDIKELDMICCSMFDKMEYSYEEVDVNEELAKPMYNRDSNDDKELIGYTFFKDITELNEYKLYERIPVLRDFQVEAYKWMKQNVNSPAMTWNIMCRCGKTILFQKFAYEYSSKYDFIIYVSPRLSLIADMITRWIMFKDTHRIIEFSSSESKYTKHKERRLSKCIQKKKPGLLFVCNDSFHFIEKLLKGAFRLLLIFDEAHHLCTKINTTIITEDSDNDEENEEYKNHPLEIMKKYSMNSDKWTKIFATATLKTGNIFNKTRYFMNDPEYFAPDYTYTFTDIHAAMNAKPPFMCSCKIIIGHSKSRYNEASRYEQCIRILQSLINTAEFKPKKILMYANRVNNIKTMRNLIEDLDAFPGHMLYAVYSEPGRKPSKNRNQINKFIKSETGIMINCNMLTDGINITDLDTVVLMDPRHAKVDIVQCILRCRSYKPNKMAYVILPFIEDSNNPNEYETALTVIDELYNMNDPNVRIQNIDSSESKSSSSTRRISTDMFVPKIMGDNIIHKILEITNDKYCKCPTLSDAILKVLQDECPRTSTEIWKQICTKELLDGVTSLEICSDTCLTLAKGDQILCKYVGDVCYYYIEYKFRGSVTMEQFIQELKDRNIRYESDYRKMFAPDYAGNFIHNPYVKYPKFTWSLLLDVKPYSLEECKSRIAQLMTNDIIIRLNQCLTTYEKLLILHRLDNRIPIRAEKIYNISRLEQLHVQLSDSEL